MDEKCSLRNACWDSSHREYTCADGITIACQFDETVVNDIPMPRNGLRLRQSKPPVLVTSEIQLSRDMVVIEKGRPTKTCTFPQTVVSVCKGAFKDMVELQSVKFNEGLEKLGDECFNMTKIRRLVFPSSIENIEHYAFFDCVNLKCVDLRAARKIKRLRINFHGATNLETLLLGDGVEVIKSIYLTSVKLEELVIPNSVKCIEDSAFMYCNQLKRVVFTGEGLETIEDSVFTFSGLESFTAPASLKKIGDSAFSECRYLRHVDLSACTIQSNCEDKFLGIYVFKNSALESVVLPRILQIIKEYTFENCEHLKSVSFGEDPMLEEIESCAFLNCGFESFVVPPRLKKIGDMAFGRCHALRNFQLNDGIQEFGWLCFWGTRITNLTIPPQVCMTPEQLGFNQKDLKVLRLPDGLETVGCEWFWDSDIEKVIVPSSVKIFDYCAFCGCEKLREVVFKPGSCLEHIEDLCFLMCGLKKIVIPKSVKYIGDNAFEQCNNLSQLRFEPGNKFNIRGNKARHWF